MLAAGITMALVGLVLAFVLLVVYTVRLTIRLVALWAAVVFFQAEGTSGDVITMSSTMFTYIVRGPRKRKS